MQPCSLEEQKAQLVVDEIKLAGGDALAVGGDVSADDFPDKVINATIKYVLFRAYRPRASIRAASGSDQTKMQDADRVLCPYAGSTARSTTL